MKTIGILGAGGHSKVVIDLIEQIGDYRIVGVYDDHKVGQVMGYPILGGLSEIDLGCDEYVMAMGRETDRARIDQQYVSLNWARLVHPRAIVARSAQLGVGTVVCAGAVIQPEVTIGRHGLINTNCNVDHEVVVGDYCSISPGATICGQVHIGHLTLIGANATVIQNMSIGARCLIGAGTVVIRSVEDDQKVVGNPGRNIKN